MTQDEAKKLVAKRAVELVEDGMAVGLGTGSTSKIFIEQLGERVREEKLRLRCVASSEASQALAASLGMDVMHLTELPQLDLYIDGADEVGPNLALIKGGGGALLREKIVASAARQFIVVVDSTKVVGALGKFPLPVEVIQMAVPLVERQLNGLGLAPQLRMHADGSTYLTDEGNHILDCHAGLIADPAKTAAAIRSIIGVVEHGLFLNMASMALVGGENGVNELYPSEPAGNA